MAQPTSQQAFPTSTPASGGGVVQGAVQMVFDPVGGVAQAIVSQPGVLSVQAAQAVAVGAASAASSAVQTTTNRVILSSTTACWVAIGPNPTAVANTAGSIYVPAAVVMPPIGVTPGITKVAVIQASAGGYLSIIESV